MPAESAFVGWIVSSLLLSLRIAPVFAVAPPFTLTRVPAAVRVLFGLGVAACLVGAQAPGTWVSDFTVGRLVLAAAAELFVGSMFVLAFQLTFAALQMAGRTVDIQAGYGLATLIDPTTRTQTPLVGTLWAYTAAVVFFASGGCHELLRILAASLDAIPIGAGRAPADLGRMTGFISGVFVAGLGVAGGVILTLFLVDLAIALLGRTMPAMNVLVMGFQVKTLALLLVLPATFGVTSALILRMVRASLVALPGLL